MALLVPVNVSYDADPDRVERVLLDEAVKAVGEVQGLVGDPPPVVRFIPGFGEYALGFTLIVQVDDFVAQYPVQHELRKRIVKRLAAEGIRIPLATRALQVQEPARAADRPTP
jgi:small-conductance mechanosensitive channel